ncbi:MAG: glycosyltransferase [Polyangiales bacterium]
MAEPFQTTIVVPCYNEAERLAVTQFRDFAVLHPEVRFLFVNDGSRDDTLSVLRGLHSADSTHFLYLDLPRNGGKAEAVRSGMLEALVPGVRYVGYWDADLATPLAEIPRFIAALETEHGRDICFGSRVRLLGRLIERQPLRHYLGRLFATVASHVLDLPVYDTQCGAKLFRVSDETRALFAEPFNVNWTFDVELIARLQARRAADPSVRDASARIYELPLREWRDVAGSKVKPTDFLKGIAEMFRVYHKYGRGGRKPQPLRALRTPESTATHPPQPSARN